MWPLAILLIAVTQFYLFAFMGTLWAWVCSIADLLQGKFIRAAIWFSLGLGGLWWWTDENISFDEWWQMSLMFVTLSALLTFARFYVRHQRAAQAVTPLEPAPFEPAPVVNINIVISPGADRRAVHDSLAALASSLRSAIGTEQGPRGGYPVRLPATAAKTYPTTTPQGRTRRKTRLGKCSRGIPARHAAATWSLTIRKAGDSSRDNVTPVSAIRLRDRPASGC
jgi:hypothetical protein